MTSEKKYANSYSFPTSWTRPANALGVEDDICAWCSVDGKDIILLFPDFSDGYIEKVEIGIKSCVGIGESHAVYIWNSISWIGVGYVNGPTGVCGDTVFHVLDITSVLDTVEKVNACKMRLIHNVAGGGPGNAIPYTSYVDAVYVEVTYGVPSAAYSLQDGLVCMGVE